MNPVKKYSRQREAVLNALCSVKSHPSADAIYESVKKEIPNISLGTVYRNLAELHSQGKILKLDVGTAKEHYDGTVKSHYHLYCEKCGCITDIDMPPFSDIDAIAEKSTDAHINSHTLVFYGFCKNCK